MVVEPVMKEVGSLECYMAIASVAFVELEAVAEKLGSEQDLQGKVAGILHKKLSIERKHNVCHNENFSLRVINLY